MAGGAPAELEWLHLVRLSARVDETSVFPFLAFLRMGSVAPDRCSQVARGDPNSLIREVADSLRAGTLGHASVTTLGNAAVARHFPAFSLAMELLPAALRAPPPRASRRATMALAGPRPSTTARPPTAWT